jgi:general stress protein 26
LLAGMEYALLTTHASDGALVSRPLQLLQADAACALWFFTSATSGKVDEIRADARVNVAFADPSKKIFLSISGNASIIDDRARAEALWSPAQQIFYPQGSDDPALTLLRIVPHTAYYWDGNESAWGLLKKFGKAVLLREASDLGTSAQLDVGE